MNPLLLSQPVDLSVSVGGIASPNPFWLASGPPTNTLGQVLRAFDAGWGGAVWKTLGENIANVSSRYGALAWRGRRMMGFNNIELISDRTVAENVAEMAEVKRTFPRHALIASMMFEDRETWQRVARECERIGVDGLELNFGCPHGMCERGMGSVVGQNPPLVKTITRWVSEATGLPVLVKLTPNVTDITEAAMAAYEGGATGVSLINTIQSIIGVDLDTWSPLPSVGGQGTHGGYCGPAVKPIALHKVSAVAQRFANDLPPGASMGVSGIGGIETWQDAAEFMLLGAHGVQLCTAVMHHGFGLIDTLTDGLTRYVRSRGLTRAADLTGGALPQTTRWEALNMNYHHVAQINPDTCIGCQKCFVACEDGAHQAIALVEGTRVPEVVDAHCVGCNLCLHVCPVDGCITMVETADSKAAPPLLWAQHPKNPAAGCALV